MAFESLSDKLNSVFKKLKGQGVLTESNISDAMREIKLALLEADVNFKVVKNFTATVKERALGTEVMESLNPGQQVVKIVHEELEKLLGSEEENRINYGTGSPNVIMLVGLQGAGKTTMAAKLAGYLKKKGKKPMLVACDIYRPAAVEQLKINAGKVDVPIFEMGTSEKPEHIVKKAMNACVGTDTNLLIIDTAGRLQVDEEMMDELDRIKKIANPSEIMLVVDAMTGQAAVDVAQGFNDRLGITGVAITKLDGDTRGGAALSIKALTGVPIKFAGVGEKLEDIETFHPDRMARRILGMGDVLTAIEKAQEAFDNKEAEELSKRVVSKDFNLDDFLGLMQQMKKMGGIGSIMGMLPTNMTGGKTPEIDEEAAEKGMKRMEAIISSMTKKERRNPKILDMSRKRRIVRGSGTSIQELNRLLKQFEQSREMMKQFSGKGFGGKLAKKRLMNGMMPNMKGFKF